MDPACAASPVTAIARPELVADGARIAFVNRNSIWTMRSGGGGGRTLIGLEDRTYVGSPAWRPVVPERGGR